MGDDFRLHRRVIQFQDRCLHATEQDMSVENNKGTQKKRERQTCSQGSQIAKKASKETACFKTLWLSTIMQADELSKTQTLQKQRNAFPGWWYSSEDMVSAASF